MANPNNPFGGKFKIQVQAQAPQESLEQAPAGDATARQVGEQAVSAQVHPRREPTAAELEAARMRHEQKQAREAEAAANAAFNKRSKRRKRAVQGAAATVLAAVTAGTAALVSSGTGSGEDKAPAFATAPSPQAPQSAGTATPEADAVQSYTVRIEPLKPDTDTKITTGETGHLSQFLPPERVSTVAANGSVDISQDYTKYTITSPTIRQTNDMPKGELELVPLWTNPNDPNSAEARPEDPRIVILKNTGNSADVFVPTKDPHFAPAQMPDTIYAVQWKDPSGKREDVNLLNLEPTADPNNELTFNPYERQAQLDSLPALKY